MIETILNYFNLSIDIIFSAHAHTPTHSMQTFLQNTNIIENLTLIRLIFIYVNMISTDLVCMALKMVHMLEQHEHHQIRYIDVKPMLHMYSPIPMFVLCVFVYV